MLGRESALQSVVEVSHTEPHHPSRPKSLHLICISTEASRVTSTATTNLPKANCLMMCGKPSGRVHHSRHTRTLANLPWQGGPVDLRPGIRQFFCDNRSCERSIFAERLPRVIVCYARRIEGLDGRFTPVSFTRREEAGARLLEELGAKVSGDTLLKSIRSLHLEGAATPRP